MQPSWGMHPSRPPSRFLQPTGEKRSSWSSGARAAPARLAAVTRAASSSPQRSRHCLARLMREVLDCVVFGTTTQSFPHDLWR